jgi:peptidoglycan/LPS O-acetylase OafA/YrhL
MRKAIFGASLLVPLVAFALVVLYAIYFPPANSNIGWPIIYASILLGALLAGSSQRTNRRRVLVAVAYLATAGVVVAVNSLLIACRVFGDCP